MDSTRILNCYTLQWGFLHKTVEPWKIPYFWPLYVYTVSYVFSYVSIRVFHMTVIVKREHLLGNYDMCCVCRKWMKLSTGCANGQINNGAVLSGRLKGASLQWKLVKFQHSFHSYSFQIVTRANYKDYFPCLYNQKLNISLLCEFLKIKTIISPDHSRHIHIIAAFIYPESGK